MHFPPAVSFPFDRSAAPWRLLLVILLTGGGVCSALALQQPELRTWISLAAAWGFAASGLAIAWTFAPAGRLAWDGQHWHCTAWPNWEISEVHIAMDFQSHMLVAFKAAGGHGPRWVWLRRESDAQHWHALRCALVAARQ